MGSPTLSHVPSHNGLGPHLSHTHADSSRTELHPVNTTREPCVQWKVVRKAGEVNELVTSCKSKLKQLSWLGTLQKDFVMVVVVLYLKFIADDGEL